MYIRAAGLYRVIREQKSNCLSPIIVTKNFLIIDAPSRNFLLVNGIIDTL